MRGANSIYVGGFNMGAFGADAGTNTGVWNVHGIPPGPRCEPGRTEERPTVVTNYSPYTYSIPNQYRHTVPFATGSSRMSDLSLQQLEQFVDNIVQNYDFPDQRISTQDR